ncbi:DEAD/DEAH box helicase [Duganella radicis]|uniref:Uncharacterized protein n=1 Tax=Duganella radicis TaxID=551988 RepID=A0A6L6PEM3_9BURK|nr:AAA domain-containing protein [Duganella radicis]MTV37480.1 hypothetical protein [Duganella radicis]
MVQAAQQRLIEILDYWHKVEFFIPFDLDQVTDVEEAWKLRWIKPDQLETGPSNYFERFDIPEDRKITGFRLYIGLFDAGEIAAACKKIFPTAASGEEEDERGTADGRSCFARIDLNVYGEPSFDPVSVSTVPWALGCALARGIGSLTSAAFEDAKFDLKDLLEDFRTRRPPAKPAKPGGAPIAPLTGVEISQLLSLFAEWAGFAPSPEQPLLLELRTSKKREDGKRDNADVEPHDDDEDDGIDIDILNSFYIEDIERAMSSLRAGSVPVLESYLSPLPADQRMDLYAADGRLALLDWLHPSRYNHGHWLSQASHSMSLMQQFAINAALDKLRDGGMFAVNGPPGTGKTTLLREIFADNIVRRAAVLAGLNTAADAFSGKVKVEFRNGKSTWMGRLRPELTGFEMVVASSNNAAVENISRDLPKLKSLGEDWRANSYLKSVAYRIAAEDEDGIFHPSPESEPWGLISCALGNSENRRRFVSKFYHNNWNEEVEPDPTCQNIREWLDSYQGPSFSQAAQRYRELAAKVEHAVGTLAAYATLWRQYQGTDAEAFCKTEYLALQLAHERLDNTTQEHTAAQAMLAQLQQRQADLREEERLLGLQRPAWWVRWFQPSRAARYRDECMANAGEQRALLREVAAAREALGRYTTSLSQQTSDVHAARTAWQGRMDAWNNGQEQLRRLRQQYAFDLPSSPDALEQDKFQIAGLWHDNELAQLRSELFAAALTLHEAWLAEVGKGGGFGGNLFALAQLLTNQRPDDDTFIPLIWQSLFMVVPVVSTTFASLARQFHGMGADAIGWLFIDEAGQAVPQAAVGGLWRARRAIVVGDPLQIEPVFTVPRSLIRALSAQSVHTAGEAYAPDKVSVQRLADEANRYGTLVPLPGGDGLWIGSPLRVHRRCADPMFSMANTIAYDGKMVIETARRAPQALKVPMGESAWIELGGQVDFKQVVPQQIDFVGELIARLYRLGDDTLPELFIISPFKAVRHALRRRIVEIQWPGQSPGRKTVKKWCKNRIGTVHTFQGKEAPAVIMVLGVDADHAGSATWAASKPNLLNVALTRAQQHFYMVGAADVWRGQPYFGAVYAKLPVRSPAEFLAGVVTSASLA